MAIRREQGLIGGGIAFGVVAVTLCGALPGSSRGEPAGQETKMLAGRVDVAKVDLDAQQAKVLARIKNSPGAV